MQFAPRVASLFTIVWLVLLYYLAYPYGVIKWKVNFGLGVLFFIFYIRGVLFWSKPVGIFGSFLWGVGFFWVVGFGLLVVFCVVIFVLFVVLGCVCCACVFCGWVLWVFCCFVLGGAPQCRCFVCLYGGYFVCFR